MFILSDFLTVSETANETPTEDGAVVNTPKNLSLEATLINHTFLQQVLKKVRHLADKNIFILIFKFSFDWLIFKEFSQLHGVFFWRFFWSVFDFFVTERRIQMSVFVILSWLDIREWAALQIQGAQPVCRRGRAGQERLRRLQVPEIQDRRGTDHGGAVHAGRRHAGPVAGREFLEYQGPEWMGSSGECVVSFAKWWEHFVGNKSRRL